MPTSVVKDRDQLSEDLKFFAKDIKLSHSIFALPFVGVSLALNDFNTISATQFSLIILCMVLARSFAMGMNRFLDRDIDSENDRTKVRAIPSGEISPKKYLTITLVTGILFVACAFLLSNLAGWLSPVLLVLLMSYSFMKRLTWLTHWYLGMCLGFAPLAAEIALYHRITLPVILVGMAVAFWTAGFDLLYSLQDRTFDLSKGLHSVPSKLGHKAAIWMSRVSFLFMIVLLSISGQVHESGWAWYLGVCVVGVILAVEHWIIRGAMVTGTSNKINVAFFNLNAAVSVLFFVFSWVDYYVR